MFTINRKSCLLPRITIAHHQQSFSSICPISRGRGRPVEESTKILQDTILGQYATISTCKCTFRLTCGKRPVIQRRRRFCPPHPPPAVSPPLHGILIMVEMALYPTDHLGPSSGRPTSVLTIVVRCRFMGQHLLSTSHLPFIRPLRYHPSKH